MFLPSFPRSVENFGGLKHCNFAQLDPQAFETVLKLRAEVEGQWGGHPPAIKKYYEDAYFQAALTRIKPGQ